MKELKMAVIGKDVSKSLSPKMHTFIMKNLGMGCTYDAISVPENEFEERIGGILRQYDALNVTIPYKLSVIPKLKKIHDDAEVFGAVNTVKTHTLEGYNTDGIGFLLLLENAGVEVKGKRVLVLGVGGVGRSVVKKLLDAGATVCAYDLNRENLNAVKEEFPAFTALSEPKAEIYDVVINCTGVGMHKTEGISPVGGDLLSLCGTAVDLIYVPPKTEFLRIAEAAGKRIVNGEPMLFYQAYYADCVFLNRAATAAEAKELFEKYKTENEE